MKKESMFLLGLLVVGMIAFTACPAPTKVLFFQQDGNYVLDNNYIMQAATKMSATDIEDLLRLDNDYFDKTQGKLILVNSSAIRNLTQVAETGQVNEAGKVIIGFKAPAFYFDWKGWLHKTDYSVRCQYDDNIIDWKQYGDLKTRLDAILTKYNPVLVDNHYVIQGDRIATAAAQISEADISSLSLKSIRGVEEYMICPDPKGVLKVTTRLISYRNLPFDIDLREKVNVVLSKYQQGMSK
jgi:hypothetical protein